MHLKCPACKALRRQILGPSEPESLPQEAAIVAATAEAADGTSNVVVEAEATSSAVVAATPVSNNVGRPGGGKKVSTLQDWLDAERPGVYRRLRGSLYFCVICQTEAQFHRSSMSGKSYVMKHEGYGTHRNALKRQEGSIVSTAAGPCPGVVVGAGLSSIDKLRETSEAWLASGMLKCLPKDKKHPEPLDQCTLMYQEDNLILKHSDCTGSFVGGSCCALCVKLSESKQLHLDLARWGLRFALVEHARALAQGTEEDREDTMAAVASGDFYQMEAVRREADEILDIEQEEARFLYIKRKLDSINKRNRTERLDQWIRDCVVKLTFNKAGETERKAYHCLSKQFCESVQSGKVSTKDLSLAARVASGELNSCKLVSCLVHSFFSMRDRVRRGCKDRLCSGKHLSDEAVAEIAVTLGLDGKSKTLLRNFGVALHRSASIDYTSDTLPQFFVAHESMERLTTNAGLAIQLLQAETTRGFFLAVDETCWKPTYAAVAGLRDPMQAAILGGHFDSSDNWSILYRTDNLPEEKQAHLSLHFLLCRTDQIHQSFCMSMLPMPHNSAAKAPLMLEYAGQALQATANANGVPAMGVAMDGATTNSQLLRATLGLLPQSELSQATFFSECSTEAMPAKIRYWPFRSLVWKKKHRILGSLDCLHALKRYTTHHFAGSRVVHFGHSAMIPSTLLVGGIPYKSYVGYDAQSDKECMTRLNPTYVPAQPHTWGVWVYQLIGSLASCGWEGSRNISAHDRFSDCCMGYYLLLLFCFLAKHFFPDTWSKHWLPIQTTRNLAYVCGLGMILVMPRPEDKDTAVLGDCFAEKIVEHHFSAIKAHCRGRPCLRDGVTGTQKVHMAHAGKPLQLKEPKTGPALTDQVVSNLAATAWELSVRFVTWVEPGLTSSELQQNFQLWWASEGLGIFSMNKNHEWQDDESEDDAAGDGDEAEVLEDDSKEASADKDLETLQCIEDHLAAKAEMSAMAEAGPSKIVSDEAEAESAETSHSFMHELKKCCDTEAFDDTESSCDACLKRQQRLIPLIKAYVTQTRQRERIISVGGAKYDSQWHRMEHELAVARAASLHDGSRMSRASQWRAVQNKVEHAVSTDETQCGPIRAITHYRPEQSDSRQTVLLRLEGYDNLQVGIVRAVFRGSVSKKSGETTRRMRTAKLSVHPLPASSCSRVLVHQLVQYSEHSFYQTGMSPIFLVDPVQHIVGEVQLSQCIVKQSRIQCTISKETLDAVAKLEAQPDLLEKMPLPNIPVPEPGELKTEQKLYTFQDFTRTMAGTKAIEGWMRELPRMYETAGIELLKEGKIRVKMPGGQDKDFAWESIVLRAADALDLLLDTLAGKKYGKAILHKFLDLLPDASDKKRCVNQVRMFVAQVDQTAAPVPRPRTETHAIPCLTVRFRTRLMSA